MSAEKRPLVRLYQRPVNCPGCGERFPHPDHVAECTAERVEASA